MAQSITGTNLAANWAATTARPTYKVEVDWDRNGLYTDETLQSNLRRLSVAQALYDPLAGLPMMGNVRPGQASITLDNIAWRYSPDNAAGALYSAIANGIYRVPIKISLGYIDATNGAELVQVFTGEIENAAGADAPGDYQVTFDCLDNTIGLLQYKHQTIIHTDQLPDAYLATILAAAGAGSTSLDKGNSPIPYCWMDDENVSQEAQQVAAADGGWFYADELGVLQFKRMTHLLENAHSKTSQLSITASHSWHYADDITWRDVYNKVIVSYVTRRQAKEQVIYEADEPIAVPPDSAKTVTARYKVPAIAYIHPVSGTDYTAVDAGMTDRSASISIAVTGYGQQATLVITNAHTTQTVYLLHLKMRGYPIASQQEHEIARTSDLSPDPVAGTKVYPLRNNDYLQTAVQAERLAGFLIDRLKRPRRILVCRAACAPWLQLGDRVTVTHHMIDAGAGSTVNTEGYIVEKSFDYNGQMMTMQLSILPVTNLFAYSDYFTVGTSECAAADGDVTFY